MPEGSQLPVAIRITRPYASEDEYLEREAETLSRVGITLIGAQARPDGAILRFELVLAGGHVLLRGEGRVVGFKQDAYEGSGGLTLRFTRLDMRSKALVDRAAAVRERNRPPSPIAKSERPPSARASIFPRAERSPSLPPPPSFRPLPASPQTLPMPSPVLESVTFAVELPQSDPSLEEVSSSPSVESFPALQGGSDPALPLRNALPPSSPERESGPAAPDFVARSAALQPPAGAAPSTNASARDALLGRLRVRAKGLDPETIAHVLAGSRQATR